MKFASRTFLILSAVVSTIPMIAAHAADTFAADPVHSSVVFRVKHMNTSYAWGRFDNVAGSFALDQADPTQSKLTFTVKAGSVNTNNPARDNHLKSPDFFNAVQYPNITFASESVSKSDKWLRGPGKPDFPRGQQADDDRPDSDRERQGHEGERDRRHRVELHAQAE